MLAGADGGEGLAELLAVAGEVLRDAGRVGKADEHGRVAGAHLVDQLADAPLGLFQSVGLFVGGLHAGRVVDEEHQPAAAEVQGLPRRPQQGQEEDEHHQKLQIEQQVVPQPLPDRVDVQVFDRLVPEVGGGHLHGRRLSLRKYSSTIAGGTAASAAHCHQVSKLESSGSMGAVLPRERAALCQ